MNEYTVVVNDCAAVAATGGPISIRSQNTLQGQRNFLLNLRNVAAGLPRQLNQREMDLAESAGHIFAIDLACPRGRGDVEWARSIEAHLPVRDPDFWNARSLRKWKRYSATSPRIAFNSISTPTTEPELPPRQRTKPFSAFDCIALISGGVDSFVGGLSLLDGGRRPLGVSHTAAGATTQAQGNVADALGGAKLPGFERVGFTAKKEWSHLSATRAVSTQPQFAVPRRREYRCGRVQYAERYSSTRTASWPSTSR